MTQEIADSKLIDTWSSDGLKVKPDISKIIEGWQLGEQPPHEYMNWLQNTFGSKLNHILKNGVVKWNDETEYLVGSSVQHSGNVWLCKVDNTNSEPTDANANWKRIITVEALTTVLGGYVALAGNQTIAGVKTFSSSPIVPTPTTGTQAANKGYVDANSIGVGQTWQDVSSSRTIYVNYTNTTGRAIALSIWSASSPQVDSYVRITVNDLLISQVSSANSGTGNSVACVFAIIPPGATYSANAVGSNTIRWSELRS